MNGFSNPTDWLRWLENAQQSWSTPPSLWQQWSSAFDANPFGTNAVPGLPQLTQFWQQLAALASQAEGAKPEAFLELLQKVFEPWQKQWLDQLKNTVGGENLAGFAQMGKLAEFPGIDLAPLGPTREYLRQHQAYAQMNLELPERMLEWQRVMGRFPQLLQDELQTRAAKLASEDRNITSARGVFDFWVDAAEAAFATLAHSEAYGQAQGRLSNLLMEMKIARQQMLDQAIEVIGLPSRRELDSTHRRMASLRRENRSLRSELSALREAVDQLRNQNSRRKAPAKSTTRKEADPA